MNSENSYEDSISRVAEQADVVGRLAQDSGAFAAVVAAFEAKDRDAFRWVLERLELLPRCELVCEWIRIKLCVLRCIEVCGPPRAGEETPNLQQFAEAVARVTSDDKLLRRIVDAIECGDGSDFRAALTELKLEPYCHLLCHWVCSIIYRRVCHVVCWPDPVFLPDAIDEMRAAGQALAEVVADKKAMDAIAKAAAGRDCEALRSAIPPALMRRCEIICKLICVWRCVWVCRELCRRFDQVPAGVSGIDEAREFALAARSLARRPRALGDLVNAVLNRDADAYAAVIGQFGLTRYCLQVCAWVCSVVCHRLCVCVCPPNTGQPWFTAVGHFNITSDIDATSGKTNKSVLGHGGPNYAFLGCLELRGFCPVYSPVFGGVQMQYRFTFTKSGGSPLPVTANLVCPVVAGTRIINWPQNLGGVAQAALVPTFQSVDIAPVATPDPTPPAPGAVWFGPAAHTIAPDPDGWVTVDPLIIGGGFQTLMGFDTTQPQAAPGGDPIAGPPPVPPVNPGDAVPAGSQRAGTDMSITFEARRVTVATVDYTNSLSKIRVNNWVEVHELWFAQFGTNCCTPIDAALDVQFTVDHEEMDAGKWSLEIKSCSKSAPGDITPAGSGPGVTVTARGGNGTIHEDTHTWNPCSYTVWLHTRPGLTTGLIDRDTLDVPLTFCICGHRVGPRPPGG